MANRPAYMRELMEWHVPARDRHPAAERVGNKWRLTLVIEASDNGYLTINGGPMNANTFIQSWVGLCRVTNQMIEQFVQDKAAPAMADHLNSGGNVYGEHHISEASFDA
jgi:hypothetical protein